MREHVKVMTVNGRICPMAKFKEWWGYEQEAVRCGSSQFFNKKRVRRAV